VTELTSQNLSKLRFTRVKRSQLERISRLGEVVRIRILL